jgi:predicted MFS family arabinose efflux permease
MEDSRRYERRLVVLLFFTWGIVFLDRMSQLYLAPYFAPEFHLRAQQIGVLTAVLAISWAVSGFFFGALSDRFGRRVVLIPAILGFSALSWISGLAHNFEQLLLARALMGLAEGPCWPVITALIEETSPPERRGRNVGIVVSAAALAGLALAPILTTQVAAHFGWRWAFFLAGIPGILISLLIARFVKEPKPHACGAGHEPASLSDYFSLLRHRNIWLCSIGAFGFMAWLFVENAFAPLYITEVAHQSPTTAGWLLGISGLGSFFVGFLLPALSDRVGRKPTLLVVSLFSTMIPIALQIPLLYQHQWLLAAIIFVTNGGQCMPALIMVLVPTESVPARFSATAIGLVTLVGEILGATAAPALAGTLAGKYGLGVCLWMSAGGTMLVFLASLFLKETVVARNDHRENGHL